MSKRAARHGRGRAADDHMSLLKKGVRDWNAWRAANPDVKPSLTLAALDGADLRHADLSGTELRLASLRGCHLEHANLTGALLSGAFLSGACLDEVHMTGAELYGAHLEGARLRQADLKQTTLATADLQDADLSDAKLHDASISRANLARCNLTGAQLTNATMFEAVLSAANLEGADLSHARLDGAKLEATRFYKTIAYETDFTRAVLDHATVERSLLIGANLSRATLRGASITHSSLEYARLVETDLSQSTLVDTSVYGVSVWGVNLATMKEQVNLRVTPHQEGVPAITVDNVEVAQFVYLLLRNERLRDVIDTIGRKGVLILGRFTQDRKAVLDAIRVRLRELDFVPLMFDFEKPTQRDFTETIKTLAGLSRFIIADITNPRSSPLELQATMPDYMIPFVPIIHESEEPFAMFRDLKQKYGDWVLDVLAYDSVANLVAVLEGAIVAPALDRAQRLALRKAEALRMRHVADYL